MQIIICCVTFLAVSIAGCQPLRTSNQNDAQIKTTQAEQACWNEFQGKFGVNMSNLIALGLAKANDTSSRLSDTTYANALRVNYQIYVRYMERLNVLESLFASLHNPLISERSRVQTIRQFLTTTANGPEYSGLLISANQSNAQSGFTLVQKGSTPDTQAAISDSILDLKFPASLDGIATADIPNNLGIVGIALEIQNTQYHIASLKKEYPVLGITEWTRGFFSSSEAFTSGIQAAIDGYRRDSSRIIDKLNDGSYPYAATAPVAGIALEEMKVENSVCYQTASRMYASKVNIRRNLRATATAVSFASLFVGAPVLLGSLGVALPSALGFTYSASFTWAVAGTAFTAGVLELSTSFSDYKTYSTLGKTAYLINFMSEDSSLRNLGYTEDEIKAAANWSIAGMVLAMANFVEVGTALDRIRQIKSTSAVTRGLDNMTPGQARVSQTSLAIAEKEKAAAAIRSVEAGDTASLERIPKGAVFSSRGGEVTTVFTESDVTVHMKLGPTYKRVNVEPSTFNVSGLKFTVAADTQDEAKIIMRELHDAYSDSVRKIISPHSLGSDGMRWEGFKGVWDADSKTLTFYDTSRIRPYPGGPLQDMWGARTLDDVIGGLSRQGKLIVDGKIVTEGGAAGLNPVLDLLAADLKTFGGSERTTAYGRLVSHLMH